MLPLLLSLAWGADPLVDPLENAIERHRTELSFGSDAPPIYHLRYHLVRYQTESMIASFGGMVTHERTPYNRLSIEMRVGTPEFDNTGFFGWENGFTTAGLPIEPTERSVELAAWRITDRAYKNAVEQFSRKTAQVRPPPDHPGDYVLSGPTVHQAEPLAASDTAALRDLALELSAIFTGRPGVERGEVHIGHEAGAHTVLDSEGTRVVRPSAETSIRALMHVRTADGHQLVDERLWTVRHVDDLPSPAAMKAQVQTMADDLVALAQAPVLDEEVVGPVLFTGRAAQDLFRYLLLPQLEGTPPESPFDTFLGEIGDDQDTVRVGRRVLPPGWTVVDDPTADLSLPGSFTHDYEGTPAQRVELVESGVVRQVLTSRVPRKETQESTGHARGSFGTRLAARPSATEVTPDRRRKPKRLHRMALRLAAPYGRDWYVRVDDLADPAVADSRSFSFNEPSLPSPVRIVRVNADGSEQVLRGARFAGVERWLLRDIAAAGASTEQSVLLGTEPGRAPGSPTGGLPAWIRVPNVLVGEIEVLPAPPNRRDAPVLPHPVERSAVSAD